MKHKIRQKTVCLPVIACAVVALGSASHAAILVNESFSNYTVGSLTGQAATGYGLSGNWSGRVNNVSGTTSHGYQAAGLSMTGAYSSGGSVIQSGGGNFPHIATAAFSATLPTGQLYGSYLFSASTHTNARTIGATYVGGQTATDGTASYLWAGNAFNNSGTPNNLESPGIRVQGNNSWLDAPRGTLAANETYAMIFQFNADTKRTDAWVLNQAQLSQNLTSNTLTEATLSAATLGAGASDVIWKGGATSPAAAINAMTHLHLLGLQSTTNDGFTFTWDEFRVSDTSLFEVVTVPEPSAFGFAILSGMMALGRRRRA